MYESVFKYKGYVNTVHSQPTGITSIRKTKNKIKTQKTGCTDVDEEDVNE